MTEENQQAKTYPQALLGFRAWFFKSGLTSMGLGAETWNASLKKAVCKRGFAHRAPREGCSCGLYAFYDFSEIMAHRKGSIFDLGLIAPDGQIDQSGEELLAQEKSHLANIASYMIIGAIAARGHVELHWNGFRAEEMQIISLLASEEQKRDPWLQASELPTFFYFDDFLKDAKSRAASLPTSLRPDPPLSPLEVRELQNLYSDVRDEDDYRALASRFDLEVHELSDLILNLGLSPLRY